MTNEQRLELLSGIVRGEASISLDAIRGTGPQAPRLESEVLWIAIAKLHEQVGSLRAELDVLKKSNPK